MINTGWRRVSLLLVAIAAFAAFGAACSDEKDEAPPPEYHGVQISPPPEKPAGVFIDANGKPFDLRKDTEGFVTLLYIGYTHCPDICPTHMYDLSRALREIDPTVKAKLKVVFATADPARDTPEALKEWLAHFDPTFIGITGTEEQMFQLEDALSMERSTQTPTSPGNYVVSHAAWIAAFTNDNIAHLVYPSGITQDDWKHDLPLLVNVGWKEPKE